MTSRRFLGLLSIVALLPILGVPTLCGAQTGAACSSCPGDLNDDGRVTVDEILTVVNAALGECPTPGPPQGPVLLQTGQTQCDQGTGTLGMCPGSPPGQDAAVGAGVHRSYTDNGDGTVVDNATGLMWEQLATDNSIHGVENTYTWSAAFQKIATLNTSGFAGHSDWRLPNRRELESLVDAGTAHPAMDPIFNTGLSAYFWSSTTFQDVPTNAWAINPDEGDVNAFGKTVPYYVRAVRGGL